MVRKKKSFGRKTSRKVRTYGTRGVRNVPVGVRIISVLTYIEAVLLLIVGVTLILGGIIGSVVVSKIGVDRIMELTADVNPLSSAIISLIFGSLIAGGIIVLALSVLAFYIAKGLWKGNNWARIVVIVVSVISFINALAILDVFILVFTGVIGYYMWFSEETKIFYRR